MNRVNIEHVNYTVTDPDKTADLMCRLFDWKVRWAGEAVNDGRAVHVGTDDFYLALYAPRKTIRVEVHDYLQRGGLNHVGVVVEDLDATEARVLAEGLETYFHADYEPGKRFYFSDHDAIEYEVVSY